MSITQLLFYLILMIYFILSIGILLYVLLNQREGVGQLNIIKCPDCGNKTSINAKVCRHCNSEIINNKKIIDTSIKLNEKKSSYNKRKVILIVYQLIAGIMIFIGYEKFDNLIIQTLLLFALIINTISLIVFMIKYNIIRKESNIRLSILAILAIICGIIFSGGYTYSLINHISVGFQNDIREVLYLNTYSKEEARQFLVNLYDSLQINGYMEGCLSLYGMWEDDNNLNTYYVNIKDECHSSYLPPNQTKILINKSDKTKIEKIYWQFNDTIQIVFYENRKQVPDYPYLYLASLYKDEPEYSIMDAFEREVKTKLKSPSSAIFTYNGLYYLTNENRFYYSGWVESQNSFGAMVRTDFQLKLLPCSHENCDWNELEYTWNFQ